MIQPSLIDEDELRRLDLQREEMLDRRREEVRRQALADENRALRAAGVGPRYLEEISREDLIPVEVRDWADEIYESIRTRRNLVLCGPAGSGKTFAAIHCLRAAYRAGDVVEPNGLMRWQHPSFLFVRARDLFRDILSRNFDTVETASKVCLLVLDDLGAAYESDFAVAELASIFDARWVRLSPTIVTTNMTPSMIEKRYPLIWDRLSENLTVVRVVRPSLRKKNP